MVNLQNKILLLLLLAILTFCSANKKVTHDNRFAIRKAKLWVEYFVRSEVQTGIKVNLNDSGRKYLNVTIWKEPIDTVTHVSYSEDVNQGYYPNPPDYKVDITSYSFKIKNKPVFSSSVEIEPITESIFIELEPGHYFLKMHTIGYYDYYIKNVIIKKNNISLSDITLRRIVSNWY